MKYSIFKPMADGESGENSLIDWNKEKRQIFRAHVYLFCELEADIIQAYPFFIATTRLRRGLEAGGVSGMSFIPCQVSKSPQYDELSKSLLLPELYCMEPCGVDGVDDVVYHSKIAFRVSGKFLEIARQFSFQGCEISDEISDIE